MNEITQEAKTKVIEIGTDLDLIQDKSDTLVVSNPITLEHAGKLILALKARWEKVEKWRITYVKPLNDLVKEYNNQFKPYLDRLEKMEAATKRKVSDYTMQQENIRRAQQKQEQEAHDKLMAEEEAKAKKDGVEFVASATPVVKSETAMVRTTKGKISNIMIWTFEITDPEKIPKQFCKPDEAAIRKAVQNGTRMIDGVRIFEDVQVRAQK